MSYNRAEMFSLSFFRMHLKCTIEMNHAVWAYRRLDQLQRK